MDFHLCSCSCSHIDVLGTAAPLPQSDPLHIWQDRASEGRSVLKPWRCALVNKEYVKSPFLLLFCFAKIFLSRLSCIHNYIWNKKFYCLLALFPTSFINAPVLAQLKLLTIILPPPCFTMGMEFFWCYTFFMELLYFLEFDPSGHKTFWHMVWGNFIGLGSFLGKIAFV